MKIPKEVQIQAKEYLNQLYRDNPQADEFRRTKRILMWGLTAFTVVYIILYFLQPESAMYGYGGQDGNMVLKSGMMGQIYRLLIYLFLIWIAAIGNWRGGLCLYLIAVPNVLLRLTGIWQLSELPDYFRMSFMSGVLVLFSYVYAVYVAIVVLWLTVPAGNRRASEKVMELRAAYAGFIQSRMTGQYGQR